MQHSGQVLIINPNLKKRLSSMQRFASGSCHLKNNRYEATYIFTLPHRLAFLV